MRLATTRYLMASSTSLLVASATSFDGAAALLVGSGAIGMASATTDGVRAAAPASDAAVMKPRRPMTGEAQRFNFFDIGLPPTGSSVSTIAFAVFTGVTSKLERLLEIVDPRVSRCSRA